jgi:hypothetical protein
VSLPGALHETWPINGTVIGAVPEVDGVKGSRSRLGYCVRARLLDHGERAPRDADKPLLVIGDPHLPDVDSSTAMDRTSDPRHPSTGHRPEVVGVDLHSDYVETVSIDGEKSRPRRERLRKCDGGTAVEHPGRLRGPSIDGHPTMQGIGCDLGEFNSERFDEAVSAHILEKAQRHLTVPDRLGGHLEIPSSW